MNPDALEEIVNKIGDSFDLSELTDREILELAEDIVTNPELSQTIPKGNLRFLKERVEYFREVYNRKDLSENEKVEKIAKSAQGVRNTLQKAWPHQIGFALISKILTSKFRETDNDVYDRLAGYFKNAEDLSPEDLVEIWRLIISDPYLRGELDESARRGFAPLLKSMSLIVEKYDRLRKVSMESASEYAEEKASSMRNALIKSYLPNFTGYIARTKHKS